MATTIITKYGSGAPLAGDLEVGELAVDLTNNLLYSKNAVGTVVQIGYVQSENPTFDTVTVTGNITAANLDISTWDSTATTVSANSTNWTAAYTAINSKETTWDSAASTVTAGSANWDTAYSDKINSVAFNTSTGVLTLTQQDATTLTVDLDGRYSVSDTTYTGGTNITIDGSNNINLDATLTSMTDVQTSNVSIGLWDIKLDGSDLVFSYNSTDVFKITTAGAIIAKNDVTAYGAP